ncbi:hypothetical protein LIER_01022 [Lithospermum erythrorhizon]|uniref:Gag-pol polyprotein n=1 Tax=Lithospermum erythrorhizon TaxID=34254 RepID=A0AAV3NKI7_LITER
MQGFREGWTIPTVTNKNVVTVKPKEEWTGEEDEAALVNDKALNAIFNAVDINVFKLINTYTVAKIAWDTLETTYEGTQKVRMSRLQQLKTRFEILRIEDDETIVSYNKIKDIPNESFSLGELMKDGEDQEEKVSNSESPVDDSLLDESENEGDMTEEELLENYKLLYSK